MLTVTFGQGRELWAGAPDMRHIHVRRQTVKKSVLVISVVALATAPAALAKELSVTAVCGASGCKAISPALKIGHDGFGPAATVPIGNYYVLRIGFGDGHKIFQRGEMYFVASAGAVAAKDAPGPTDGWGALTAEAAASVRSATRGLKPFTVGRPTHAYVATHRAVDAVPYLALLGPLERTAMPRSGESALTISLYWGGTNPWSNAGALIQYLPKAGVVIRSDGYYRAPGSIVERARREAAGLAPTPGGAGFPWEPLVGGLAGLAAVLSSVTFLVRRRRRMPAPEGAVAT